jgi:hypothetical protein
MIGILYNVYFVYLLAYTIRTTFKNTIITIVTDPYYVLATPNTHTKTFQILICISLDKILYHPQKSQAP